MAAQRTAAPETRRLWTAKMIAPLSDEGVETPASFVATSFRVNQPVGPAELAVTAQGLYICFINGRRVGRDLLTPGLVNYDDRMPYQTYDVASLLQPGDNRIEIWLADGWYRSRFMRGERAVINCWGDKIAAFAELRGEAGTLVATDETWRSGQLPIRQSGIYYGELYDARVPLHRETHGVAVQDFDTALLVPYEIDPVVELEPMTARERWTDAEGRLVLDYGQNAAGYVRYRARGKAGAQIRVEHSEVLGPDRHFDNRNYRSAEAHTIYIFGDEGEVEYAPYFSFQGYRYARFTITGEAEILDAVSVPITSVPEVKGQFICGNELVNRLVQNTVWSQRANFIEIPTDCPQRDERLGWTGDAQVFANTACYLADCDRFFRKFMRDVMVDQRPDGAVSQVSPDPWRLHPERRAGEIGAGSTGWGDAIAIIPWTLYTHYGDRQVLEECFDAMIRWVDYLWSISDGPIVRPPFHRSRKGFTFGDWLQPVGDARKARPTIADDCAATIYHYISTDLTARIATILGRADAAAAMTKRADAIRAAFANEFIAPSGRLAHNDQTSYALGFLYDLIPPQHRDAAKEYFRREIETIDYRIGTGFIGTPAILPALTKMGMDDVAEKMFLQLDVPGWLYQVKMGATSIWERWDSMRPDGSIFEPDMNSYNHYAYGAVCQWLFESVAGIRPDPEAPGFARVLVEPAPLPGLNPVSAWHDSPRGRIEATWTLDGDRVEYTVILPEGSTGLFKNGPRYAGLTLDGAAADGDVAIPSGRHVLRFALANAGSR